MISLSNSSTHDYIQQIELIFRIRVWQHKVNEWLKQNASAIPIHLAFGYEAIAVALVNVLDLGEKGDQLSLPHRNIAYQLACHKELKPVFDEIRGAHSGCAHGKLGSMNMAARNIGLPYTSSILGNNLAVTCGLALAHEIHQNQRIVVNVCGDGSMEEGTFYEAMVFAKSQKLPVLFLVENNNQSMSSTIQERRCEIHIDKFCSSLEIPYYYAEGNDFFTLKSTLSDIVSDIRQDRNPICLEVNLIPWNNHAGATPGWPSDKKMIDIHDGIYLSENDDDPLRFIESKLDKSVFCPAINQIINELNDETI